MSSPKDQRSISKATVTVIEDLLEQHRVNNPEPLIKIAMEAIDVVLDAESRQQGYETTQSLIDKAKAVLNTPEFQNRIATAQASAESAKPFTGFSYMSKPKTDANVWLSRPLKPVYGMVALVGACARFTQSDLWLDVYAAYAVDAQGYRDVLGLWWDEVGNCSTTIERALKDLRARGVEHIAIAQADEDGDFEKILHSVFPDSLFQGDLFFGLDSLRDPDYQRDYHALKSTLRKIYRAKTLADAEKVLNNFTNSHLGKAYPYLVQDWQDMWDSVARLHSWSPALRDFLINFNGVEETQRCLDTVAWAPLPDDSVFKILVCEEMAAFAAHWTRVTPGWAEARRALEALGDERLRAEPPVPTNEKHCA